MTMTYFASCIINFGIHRKKFANFERICCICLLTKVCKYMLITF